MEESAFFKTPKITSDLETRSTMSGMSTKNATLEIYAVDDAGKKAGLIYGTAIGKAQGKARLADKDNELSIAGDYGSLIKGTFNFVAKGAPPTGMNQLNLIDKELSIGTPIIVKYAYSESTGPGELDSGKSKEYKLVVYDFSYNFGDPMKSYEHWSTIITIKCVGAGSFITKVNAGGSLKKLATERIFISRYRNDNLHSPVTTIFDVFDFDVQSATDQLDVFGGFTAEDGHVAAFKTPKGKYSQPIVIFQAPDAYENPDQGMVSHFLGINATQYISYASLGYIVDKLINHELLNNNALDLPDAIKNKRYKCDPETTVGGNYRKWMFSAEPFNVLITGDDNQLNYSREEHTGGGKGGGQTKITGKNFNSGKFKNSGYKVYNTGELQAAISNILISRDFLRQIQGSAGEGKDFTIDKFLKTIFDKITDVSGGAFNLSVIQDPDDENVLLIVNQDQPAAAFTAPKPYEFDVSDDKNLVAISIGSKVPSAMAAEAFAGKSKKSAGTVEDQKTTVTGLEKQQPTAIPEEEVPTPKEARTIIIPDGSFDADTQTAAKAVLKHQLQILPAIEKTEQAVQAFPLTLTVTLRGIEGFQFGDCVTTTFLPDRYKSLNTPGLGVVLVFTVLNVTQKFSKVGGRMKWTTSLKTICRLVNKVG